MSEAGEGQTNETRLSAILVAASAIAFFVLGDARAQQRPVAHRYVIQVEGTPGIQLDMLLVTLHTGSPPTKRLQRVTVPCTTTLTGSSCYAWFDDLPRGASGPVGSRYRITFIKDGDDMATTAGALQGNHHYSTGIGDIR
ncbi:MAG: hypothetical protein JO250_24135 [Armatimonadetes bacterium]|nr:hypothetical protein [Armatimonadota bacterium]